MTNGGGSLLPFYVGNFLGVSGPLPLQGTTRTDSSPGKHTVRFMGHPVAELENIQITVVEYTVPRPEASTHSRSAAPVPSSATRG